LRGGAAVQSDNALLHLAGDRSEAEAAKLADAICDQFLDLPTQLLVGNNRAQHLNPIPNRLNAVNSARQLIGKNPCTAEVHSARKCDSGPLHGGMNALDRISVEDPLNFRPNGSVVLRERWRSKKEYGNGNEKAESHLDDP